MPSALGCFFVLHEPGNFPIIRYTTQPHCCHCACIKTAMRDGKKLPFTTEPRIRIFHPAAAGIAQTDISGGVHCFVAECSRWQSRGKNIMVQSIFPIIGNSKNLFVLFSRWYASRRGNSKKLLVYVAECAMQSVYMLDFCCKFYVDSMLNSLNFHTMYRVHLGNYFYIHASRATLCRFVLGAVFLWIPQNSVLN